MRTVLASAWVIGLFVLGCGCPKGEPTQPPTSPAPPSTPTPEPTPAVTPEPAPSEPPAPAVIAAPFDWAEAVADGEHHLAVAVAQRSKRFPPVGSGGEATDEVVLQDDPPVRARAVYRESGCDPDEDGGGDGDECQGRWSLEVTVGRERWQIVDFATWTTDCAAIEDGFGRDGIELEARELVPGGAKELVIVGQESHAAYLDDCDCTTRGGGSEHVWACGLVAEGKGQRPVCWAHVETRRSVGPTQDVADCACAAQVPAEEWGLHAELVEPGKLRITRGGRAQEHELATLPCRSSSPAPVFACGAPATAK